MNTAAALLIATGMVCGTALILVCLVFRQTRRLIREALDQVKVQGRSVSVNVDRKSMSRSVTTNRNLEYGGLPPLFRQSGKGET
ncbi:MAG: hypothetical protein AB7E95_14500 [Kiritimatiellales bacterium]